MAISRELTFALVACLYIGSYMYGNNIIKLWPYHLTFCVFVMLTEERHCHGDNKVWPVWLPDWHCAPGRPKASETTGREAHLTLTMFYQKVIWVFGKYISATWKLDIGADYLCYRLCWQFGGAVNILDWKLGFRQQGLSVGCLQHLIASDSQ